LTWKRYLVGLLVIFAASYSQYFVPGINLMAGGFCVYGISIIVIGPLQGKSILRRAFRHSGIALRLGLGSFGIFTLLGMVASLLIVAILLDFDPAALNLLEKPVPVLHVPPRVASIMVWASLMVIGPCEEFIFRGFVFGGLLSLFGVRHWLALAFLSSVLFAAVHLYYLLTYGVASLVPFLDIVAVGIDPRCVRRNRVHDGGGELAGRIAAQGNAGPCGGGCGSGDGDEGTTGKMRDSPLIAGRLGIAQ
jgi:membrane protease YdiL (CAAX protease family)